MIKNLFKCNLRTRHDEFLNLRRTLLKEYMKMKKALVQLAFIIFAVISVFISTSTTIYAACSWSGNTGTVASPYAAADVSACVTDASGKTGAVTIQIPNSTPTHTATITVNMSAWTTPTSLTIRGQNDCTVDGSGIPTSCGTSIANLVISYTGKEGIAFRVAHLKVTGTSGIKIYGNGKSWRYDHIIFDTVTGAYSNRIIWVDRITAGNVTYGLIDHCYFLDPVGSIPVHYQPGVDGGNLEWMSDLGLGTVDAIYIEDNKFYKTTGNLFMTDSNGGGKFVFRYNTIHNGCNMAHDAIVGGCRGVRKWEVYNNTFTYDGGSGSNPVHAGRGGTGVFFNNTITETHPGSDISSQYVQLTIYRTYQTDGDPWDTLCSHTSGSAKLNTQTTYPVNCSSGVDCIAKDGTSDGTGATPDGYPCRDQPGASGNNPQVGGGQPFLFWNNTRNGGPIVVSVPATSTDYIKAGRDYCLSDTTMPTTCNGISTNYTPYTYPHPLRCATTPYPDEPLCPPPTISVSSGSANTGGGGGCFIATAIYGSNLDPHINVLRDFRDRHLLTNSLGQVFVSCYYRYSPPIAAYIEKHETLKTAARWALAPVIYSIKYPYVFAVVILILPVGIAVIYRKRKGRK
jgi:hypothetical protein